MKEFYCYSMRLARALMDTGFKPIKLSSNPETQEVYYVFEKTQELINFKNNVYQSVRDKY